MIAPLLTPYFHICLEMQLYLYYWPLLSFSSLPQALLFRTSSIAAEDHISFDDPAIAPSSPWFSSRSASYFSSQSSVLHSEHHPLPLEQSHSSADYLPLPPNSPTWKTEIASALPHMQPAAPRYKCHSCLCLEAVGPCWKNLVDTPRRGLWCRRFRVGCRTKGYLALGRLWGFPRGREESSLWPFWAVFAVLVDRDWSIVSEVDEYVCVCRWMGAVYCGDAGFASYTHFSKAMSQLSLYHCWLIALQSCCGLRD